MEMYRVLTLTGKPGRMRQFFPIRESWGILKKCLKVTEFHVSQGKVKENLCTVHEFNQSGIKILLNLPKTIPQFFLLWIMFKPLHVRVQAQSVCCIQKKTNKLTKSRIWKKGHGKINKILERSGILSEEKKWKPLT